MAGHRIKNHSFVNTKFDSYYYNFMEVNIMKNCQEKKEYTKENYLKNGTKTQNQWAKNKLNTTVEEPGTNKSGIEAKKNGW